MGGYSLPSKNKISNDTNTNTSNSSITSMDRSDIDLWWYRFIQQDESPLYCMFLATSADENVASLFENHGDELSEIAGDKCCIIYFRDLEKAKLLEPFQFVEHSEKVIQLIKLINVQPDMMPCVLFFEKISSGDFVYVELKKKTISELMETWRDLFAFIYSEKEVSLSAVKAFKFSEKVEISKWTLNSNTSTFSTIIFSELIKSLFKLYR